MKIQKKLIPIYYGYLIIIISEDFKAVAKKFNLKENVELYGAFAWSRINKDDIPEFLVCVPPDVSNHLIAHEVVHIVNAVFLNRGIELDRNNDEPQAYLTGYVFKEIENFLNKSLQNKK